MWSTTWPTANAAGPTNRPGGRPARRGSRPRPLTAARTGPVRPPAPSTPADQRRPTSPRRSASAPLAGRRIAVQLHGEPQEEFVGALIAAGAEVIEVPVYRWVAPLDPTPLQRLVDLITNRMVDAVTFTSAPRSPRCCGRPDRRPTPSCAALQGDVLAGCVGPLTAAPLRRRGVPVLAPATARLRRWSRPWSRSCHGGPARCAWPTPNSCCAATPRWSTGYSSRYRRPRWRSCGRWPCPPAGCCPAPNCSRRCRAGRTSTRSRWPWPGSGPRSARSSFIQTVVKRGYRLRVD